ncbi:MAG: DsrE/DsrF/DrsH-like family protein [Anaerolineae bacterium]|nr:DsrE/DsrF/DrsH-like family protein [Anaerolineae bacterium]
MDKVMGALIIATTAAAMGMETSIFFSFWGLTAIQRGNRTGKGLFGRMLGFMNRGGIDRIGPSRFNFGGIGRWMFKKMMRDKGATSLPGLLQTAIDLDVHLLACQMSMDIMEIKREDLIDAVEDVVGAATFVAKAQQSEIQLFI